MTTIKTPTRTGRYLAAERGISELTHHKEVLIERLAIETDRTDRIALSAHLEATEKLIDWFNAELAREEMASTDDASGADTRAISPGDARALSDQCDD